ncbi:MAG: 50S ribosomal protein L11 methyltransferase [Chitinophagaceae bacterium]|nr:50S ribosomal protein L11 methyltransferase [Chitinophagaceae bacterium]
MKIKKGAGVLKVLEVFSKWKTIENGLKELTQLISVKEDFLKISAEFYDLLEKDFFEFKISDKTTFGFHPAQFDSFPVHIRMLNDKARTLGFQNAIQQIITKNDIVLDIGTGTGILAAFAAKAGAKHVYAIEKSEFIEVAKTVFKQNGLEDKITLIKGHSTDIKLPEKATILVSEIIGNDPFDEDIIRTFNDAKERLLTEGAKIIPQSITVFAMAMEYPDNMYNTYQLSAENISNWKEWYGLDFSSLFEFNDSENLQRTRINNKKHGNWKALSLPIELTYVNFTNHNAKVEDCERSFSINKNGIFNGLLLFFETALTDNIMLSLHPEKIDTSHWTSQSLFISPIKVKEGEKFNLSYSLKDLKSKLKITPL